jgi:hypothetical protein
MLIPCWNCVTLFEWTFVHENLDGRFRLRIWKPATMAKWWKQYQCEELMIEETVHSERFPYPYLEITSASETELPYIMYANELADRYKELIKSQRELEMNQKQKRCATGSELFRCRLQWFRQRATLNSIDTFWKEKPTQESYDRFSFESISIWHAFRF